MSIRIVRHIGHYDADGTGGIETKTDSKGVRPIALLMSHLLNPLSEGWTHTTLAFHARDTVETLMPSSLAMSRCDIRFFNLMTIF